MDAATSQEGGDKDKGEWGVANVGHITAVDKDLESRVDVYATAACKGVIPMTLRVR